MKKLSSFGKKKGAKSPSRGETGTTASPMEADAAAAAATQSSTSTSMDPQAPAAAAAADSSSMAATVDSSTTASTAVASNLNDTRTTNNNDSSSSTSTAKGAATRTTTFAATTTTTTTTTTQPTAETAALPLPDQLRRARDEIAREKAGKRKLFHSLVKLANELRRTRNEALPALERQQYAERNWYEGGLWRAPAVLPTAAAEAKQQRRAALRQPISLSDLFFNLVVVTAFTRVGVAVSERGTLDGKSLLYFAVFWTVWSKEAAYSTRFDTTDLSAQVETLVTCFCVLFASLSVHAPLNSADGTRIMMMAAFVAVLHCFLHARVAVTNYKATAAAAAAAAGTATATTADPTVNSVVDRNVMHYAIFNIAMTALESACWLVGILAYPADWPYRWCICVGGVVLALRVPRAFLANDFHAACSQRGVLFILLLGFLLQSIVVVASDFFEYQTPTLEHYCFIGAACLMLFCIKLLYVDDSDTLAEDHALLVNRFAAFFFNIGQFSLLVSTTVMGSGLNLLTHDYMAATAALPGPAKTLVTGGFSAVLLSTFFIKSMHLKRVPTDPRNQALFIGAYVVQAVVLLIVVGIAAAMSLGLVTGGFLQTLMAADIQLLFCLSGAALFVVVMSWLDEGVELALYESAADSREFRVHPFGLWWCLQPEVSDEDMDELQENPRRTTSTSRLSVLSPLLGSSMADLKEMRMHDYQSLSSGDLKHIV